MRKPLPLHPTRRQKARNLFQLVQTHGHPRGRYGHKQIIPIVEDHLLGFRNRHHADWVQLLHDEERDRLSCPPHDIAEQLALGFRGTGRTGVPGTWPEDPRTVFFDPQLFAIRVNPSSTSATRMSTDIFAAETGGAAAALTAAMEASWRVRRSVQGGERGGEGFLRKFLSFS